MPKAKPVSLHPLSFDEAMKALMGVDPDRVGRTSKHPKRNPKKPISAKSKRTGGRNLRN
jgi:hypothetical protein